MKQTLLRLALVVSTLAPAAVGCARDAKPACGFPCLLTRAAAHTGKLLHRAWSSSDEDVWAVGLAGTIAHYDGKSWSSVESGTKATLFGVWGSSANDVWAVGSNDTVLHFDGTAWTASSTGTGHDLHAVFGTSANDVWAVGCAGAIVHFDGKAWSSHESGTTAGLYAIHGKGAKDIWAVGTSGAAVHWDGERWTSFATGGHHLYDVSVAGGNAWAVGYGTVLRYESGAWREVAAPSGDFVSIVAESGDDVWIAGFSDEVLHWDGTRFTEHASGIGGFQALTSKWAFSSDGRIVSWGRP